MENKFTMPTEVIDLPSKGLVYPESSPLSSGTIELKYMSAREEDILTNQNYLEKGIVVDKLLQSLIVSKIDYNELITGDKNAILVAARILGYGAKYRVDVTDKFGAKIPVDIDLSELKNKEINEDLFVCFFNLQNQQMYEWQKYGHAELETITKYFHAYLFLFVNAPLIELKT